jgi:hypothetical protein
MTVSHPFLFLSATGRRQHYKILLLSGIYCDYNYLLTLSIKNKKIIGSCDNIIRKLQQAGQIFLRAMFCISLFKKVSLTPQIVKMVDYVSLQTCEKKLPHRETTIIR